MNRQNTASTHLGIIMDGNRRWAKKNNRIVADGHREGFKALKALLKTIKQLDVDFLSVYAFSAENWKRSQEEVDGIMSLVRWVLINEIRSFKKENIRLRIVGSRKKLPKDIISLIDKAESETKDQTGGTLVICFNYGGHQEIVDAVHQIAESGVEPSDITVEDIEQNLYAGDIPPLDLIIRTSGEYRTSGFMLWRSAYAELIFSEKLWPDFRPDDLKLAFDQYLNRKRRFGE